MCPACIATAAWIATGTASAGGLTALAVKAFRLKERPDRPEGKPKENS